MNDYFVKARAYFDECLQVSPPEVDFGKYVEACRVPMQGLVERYGLVGARVFSLGAGYAFEEATLYDAGCVLTLLDINPDIESIVAGLPPGPGAKADANTIHWVFEEGEAWLSRYHGEPFDALYVSSMYPDEMRREEIQRNFIATHPDEAYFHITWPREAEPYHPMLMAALATVKQGGVIIFQHYRGGVYVRENPHYVEAIARQFAGHGVQLVEAHCFRDSTAHLLVAAYKGTTEAARAFEAELALRPAIRSFHGRYPDEALRNDVVRAYSLTDGPAWPREEQREGDRPTNVEVQRQGQGATTAKQPYLPGSVLSGGSKDS